MSSKREISLFFLALAAIVAFNAVAAHGCLATGAEPPGPARPFLDPPKAAPKPEPKAAPPKPPTGHWQKVCHGTYCENLWVPDDAPAKVAPAPAIVYVTGAGSAKLCIDGHDTKETGDKREFVSPPLNGPSHYTFAVQMSPNAWDAFRVEVWPGRVTDVTVDLEQHSIRSAVRETSPPPLAK